jgi:hypothetical protein
LIQPTLRENPPTITGNLYTLALGIPYTEPLDDVEAALNQSAAFDDQRLQQAVRAIHESCTRLPGVEIDMTDQTLKFRVDQPEMYPNPAAYYSDILTQTVNRPVGMVHGELGMDSILMTRGQKQTFVVDYAGTRTASRLYDYITLEIAIRRETVENMHDLAARHMLECVLHDDLDADMLPPSLQKTAWLIKQVRALALEQTGLSYHDYTEDLFSHTLAALLSYPLDDRRLSRGETMYYVHVLLLAARLCHSLNPKAAGVRNLPEAARDKMWIDDSTRKVWIKGNLIELSSNEFSILHYLYSAAGDICSPEAITENVFHETYNADQGDGRRLQTAISRLRGKLEAYEDIVKIETERSKGYRLDLL